MSDGDEYLQLSGIQHFAFCRRQWALIHVEEVWTENLRTVEGKIMHERAHNPFFSEKRKDILITREMPVQSNEMKVSGKCDVVEFHAEDDGVALHGRDGLWLPLPVEYKRGSSKINDVDRLQLCAQAMCLEEMLLCPDIATAYLYYGETRHREAVELTPQLREKVKAMFTEMHDYYSRRYTPRVNVSKSCNACSLKDTCLPQMPQTNRSVQKYIEVAIGDSE